MDLLERAFKSLPEVMRPYASKLYLSHHLGEVMGEQGEVKLARGMSGNSEGGIVLDREYMNDPDPVMGLRITRNLLAHESGHNLDHSLGASHSRVWKVPGSVSDYGERNPSEDFAETHRFVLENWSAYQLTLIPEGTVVQGTRLAPDRAPSAAKAQSILDAYKETR